MKSLQEQLEEIELKHRHTPGAWREDVPKLLAALRRCRKQRDMMVDKPLSNAEWLELDAELAKILNQKQKDD